MMAHLADLAWRQIAEDEGAVTRADQPADLQPQMFEHAANLAVLAFFQHQLDPQVCAGAPLNVGVDRAVPYPFDLYAVDQFLQLRLAHLAVGAGAIDTLHPGGGQLELPFQAAIGGHQQQAFGIQVKSTDRHQSRQALWQSIIDRRPPLGIALGRQHTRGLVKQEQPGRLRRRDGRAIDGDAIQRGQKCCGSVDQYAANRDSTISDHTLDFAARGHPGAGEELGDTMQGRTGRRSGAGRTRHAAPDTAVVRPRRNYLRRSEQMRVI